MHLLPTQKSTTVYTIVVVVVKVWARDSRGSCGGGDSGKNGGGLGQG